jgi:SNF2 family DNA or RNA helicase
MFTAERTLYPFQRVGRDRMARQRYMLLVMHMGLGKTRTVLAAVERIPLGRGLVICPASVKYQWAREILATTDQKGLVIDGTIAQRQFLWQYADKYKYVIMSFGTMLADWAIVKTLLRDFVIVDEVTNIKGMKAKRSRAVKTLSWRSKARFGLSGQPVENRPEELFSAMEFVDDDVLGRADIFDMTFIVRHKKTGKVQRYTNLPVLHRRLGPVLYRKSRYDADVQAALPAIVPKRLDPKLDRASADLYDRIVEDIFIAIAQAKSFGDFDLAAHYGYAPDVGDARSQAQGEVMSRVLALRMLCCDPGLLRFAADGETNSYVIDLDYEGALEDLPERGNKLIDRIETWTEILEEDSENKLIVFSYFKPMLRIIQTAMRGYRSVIYDGDMTARQKDAAQLEFTADPKCRMFLSSDAGGYGLNLREAQYLDQYDDSWSAGTTAQRETRNVRLDSTFESVVHIRGPVVGSVEEWMEAVVAQKQKVSEAFVLGRYDEVTGGLAMTVDSLSTFLRESTVR